MDLKLGGLLRYRRAFAIVVATVVGFAVSGEGSSAQAGARVILFVVDTSTSMVGEPLADAKSALKGGAGPSGADVGLRSFGGPCENSGIERLAIGPFDVPSFDSAVDSWRRRGGDANSGSAAGSRGHSAARRRPHHCAGLRRPVELRRSVPGCAAAQGPARRGLPDPRPWVSACRKQSELDCIARVTGRTDVSVSNTAALQAALVEASAARITSLSLSPRSFAAAAKGGTVGKVTPRKGTKGALQKTTPKAPRRASSSQRPGSAGG